MTCPDLDAGAACGIHSTAYPDAASDTGYTEPCPMTCTQTFPSQVGACCDLAAMDGGGFNAADQLAICTRIFPAKTALFLSLGDLLHVRRRGPGRVSVCAAPQ